MSNNAFRSSLAAFATDLVYRRLVQSITGYAIHMLDVDGVITTWKAGAQQAKGYTAD